MFREYWKDAGFWRWWWRSHVGVGTKIALVLALVALLLVGGYLASARLTGASAATDGKGTYILQTTVTRIVTTKVHGRTVVKRIPVVVRRTIVKSSTAYATVVDTRVVTTPGGVRYVTRKVTHYVPVVKQHVVTVNGKTTTLTETRLVPTVRTQTLTNVVTNSQTVTNQSTVVVNHTDTVVSTTVQTHTDTVTQTATVTETQTVVETVTLPAETVTATVTVPAPAP